MNLQGKTTFLIILATVLWLVITVMGWTGYWFPAMFLALALMMIHMMLGAARNGKLSMSFFIYPILIWGILWTLSFALNYHYSNMFAGRMPDFTILGLHPSFAWTVLTYWIGGVITLSIGFFIKKDLWLSDKDWDEFNEKINSINEQEGGELSDSRS